MQIPLQGFPGGAGWRRASCLVSVDEPRAQKKKERKAGGSGLEAEGSLLDDSSTLSTSHREPARELSRLGSSDIPSGTLVRLISSYLRMASDERFHTFTRSHRTCFFPLFLSLSLYLPPSSPYSFSHAETAASADGGCHKNTPAQLPPCIRQRVCAADGRGDASTKTCLCLYQTILHI